MLKGRYLKFNHKITLMIELFWRTMSRKEQFQGELIENRPLMDKIERIQLKPVTNNKTDATTKVQALLKEIDQKLLSYDFIDMIQSKDARR